MPTAQAHSGLKRNRSSDTLDLENSTATPQQSPDLSTVNPPSLAPIPDSVTQPQTEDGPSAPDAQFTETPFMKGQIAGDTHYVDDSTSNDRTSFPTSRFRAAARKAVAVSRVSTVPITSPGAEQGVDARRNTAEDHWGHIHENCAIEIVDYSLANVTVTRLDNQRLQDHLTGEGKDRPSWAKVRWINVGGISWDVMRCLALRYELHPLAVETVLRWGESARTKSDYYRTQLFLSVISHSPAHGNNVLTDLDVGLTDSPTRMNVAGDDQPSERPTGLFQRFSTGKKKNMLKRTTSRDDIENTITIDAAMEAERPRKKSSARKGNSWLMTAFGKVEDEEKAAKAAALEILKAGAGRNVGVELKHIYMFLTRGGTLITIHQDTDLEYFQPLTDRLKISDTLLRSHCDASLLMQSALDLIVDKALDVVDRYHDNLLDLERRILTKPNVESVKELHIMSGDLMLHKRTLTPLSTLVYSLRKYDLDRTIAAFPADEEAQHPHLAGFCSHQARVYLADVCDHMDFILSSMEMFGSIAENLINFTFNQVSYDTNQTMRRLTIATVTFFPATFLTGYFGMNFHGGFNALTFSDLFFWMVAIPVLAFVILAFTWQDISRLLRAMERKRVYTTAKAQNMPRRSR